MNRRRTVLAYGILGVASLTLSILLGASQGTTIEGPGPLVVDPVLVLQICGTLFVLTAVVAALDRLPAWAAPDDA